MTKNLSAVLQRHAGTLPKGLIEATPYFFQKILIWKARSVPVIYTISVNLCKGMSIIPVAQWMF